MIDAESTFEPHRPYLRGLAYRMLGSVSDAEDVVQDAFLRWSASDRERVTEPRAFLTRIVTRLCLDLLGSARVRREQYVGTWLPEPILPEPILREPVLSEPLLAEPRAPDAHAELAADLSVALLLTLERLSALERAAFLLHDVFDADYAELAETLSRSESACRQLVARAREHVRAERPRYQTSDAAVERLAAAFHSAMLSGDVASFAACLAEDAVLYSDGGGRLAAALKPIYGREKILRFVAGIMAKRGLPAPANLRRTTLNGLPGFLLRMPEGVETIALEIDGDSIAAIYTVRNPDKLRHLQQPLPS
ncbi:MAG: sigma-70 family RNA polymerase sigma factor [Deltaproteobacteria bacterium]